MEFRKSGRESGMGDILKPLQTSSLSPPSSAKVKGIIGSCLICGEISTGRHYGVVACLGCKTFFRRAVVQRQDVTCKREIPCDTSINARKACRACRYRKCLETGMSKEALQPRRDLIGCRRINRPKVPISPPEQPCTSNHRELITLIDRLTIMDERIRAQKFDLVRSKQEAMNLADRLNGKPERHPDINYEMMITLACDISTVTHIELLMMTEWFRSLPVFAVINIEDRVMLIKKFAVLNLILEHGYFTASTTSADVWLISNGTCMPRNVERLQEETKFSISADRKWRQEKLYQQMTECCIDEVAVPLRRMKLMPQEIVVLKIIMLFNCRDNPEHSEYSNVSDLTTRTVAMFRDRVIQALFAFYESIEFKDYPERFGNLILMISGVTTAGSALLESYQVMRLFKIVPFDQMSEDLLFNGIM